MILVTGGAGYIGSHTVKALKKAGFQPLIFDNFSTGHRSFVKETAAFEGDVLRNAFLVKELNPVENLAAAQWPVAASPFWAFDIVGRDCELAVRL